jgi:hypothetical protein
MELIGKRYLYLVTSLDWHGHLRDLPCVQEKAKLRFGRLWKALNDLHDTNEMGDLPEFGHRIVFRNAPSFAWANDDGYHDRDSLLSTGGLMSSNLPSGLHERD